MNIAIFGAGKAGQYLYNQIKENQADICVRAFLDNYASASPIQTIQIFKPDEYFSQEKPDAVFLAAGAQKAILQMIRKAREYGNDNIYMLQDIAGKNKLPLFENGDLISARVRRIRFSKEKPTLPYVEIPIIDSCNLNCRGCLFGCNRNGEKEYMSLAGIKRDLMRMAELFEDIPWIRILGGEPLLHPELAEVVACVRELFPDTEIDVCTNGLLIPRIGGHILQAFKNQHITVHISGYEPTYEILDTITARLDEYRLEYTVLKREQFYKFYTLEHCHSQVESYANCPSAGCRELYRGRLCKCSAVLAFERLNQQFGTAYKVERNQDWLDLYDLDITGWDIVEKLDRATQICRYCDTTRLEYFEWGNGGKARLADYIK